MPGDETKKKEPHHIDLDDAVAEILRIVRTGGLVYGSITLVIQGGEVVTIERKETLKAVRR